MSRTVLCDFDGVILDLCGAVKKLLAKRGIEFKPENVIKYNFSGDIGCSRADVFSTFKGFDLYKIQRPYEGAIEALCRLRNYVLVDGWTSVASNEKKQIEYRSFLVEHYCDGGCAYVGEKPIIVDKPIDAVFEDCLENLERWSNVEGVKLFLIDQPYNQEVHNPEYSSLFPKLIRCENFADAVDKYIKTLSV